MEKKRYRIETIIQAGQVLKAIADAKEPLGVSEVSKITGVKPNTVFRILVTLEEVGFVRAIGEKYELGMGAALLWSRYKANREALRAKIDRELKELEGGCVYGG